MSKHGNQLEISVMAADGLNIKRLTDNPSFDVPKGIKGNLTFVGV